MTTEAKKASESESHLTWIVTPPDLNRHGTLFGGQLLALADRVAAMAALRHSRLDCVTVSIDKVDFVAPVHNGYILDMTARVHFTARTSMEILVEAVAEEPRTGNRQIVCEAFFSFVAVDGDNRPTPIPPVELETERDRRLNKEARERYEARKAGRSKGRTAQFKRPG
ncbi:MAG: acyl-CoA thioesterase [Planctomycetes bacterium]|nr:acyl-CoA thioesterase [Planctomycetota bacterium]MCB9935608.1 acyl-CoA thioesterase [Planctomycetota bacterium]